MNTRGSLELNQCCTVKSYVPHIFYPDGCNCDNINVLSIKGLKDGVYISIPVDLIQYRKECLIVNDEMRYEEYVLTFVKYEL